MRSYLIGLVACFLSLSVASGADDEFIKKNAKAAVEEINEAILNDDFEKIVDLTHPKVIELAGGSKKLIEGLENKSKSMKSKAVLISSVETIEPEDPVKKGSDIYIVVPLVLKMTTPRGKLVAKSFVIGVSNDDAKTWTFVDGDAGIDALNLILPDLPKELRIPKPQKPVLEKV